MKKIIALIIAMTILSPTAFASGGITVYLNNEKMVFEQEPIIQNDSTLVPFRSIFEAFGMVVQWFGDEKRVTAEKDGLSITLFINSTDMLVNGEKTVLNTAPIIYNDFTLVPLRAISEAADADVDWDGSTKTVYIKSDISSTENWGREVLDLVNAERAEYDLEPLKWDNTLAKLAEDYCLDMINRDFFSHNTPDGKTLFDRMAENNIKYSVAGENIAYGQSSPEEVVKQWLNSPGHRKNILNPYFKYLGVGIKRGGRYGIYWVQEFANFG